MTSEFASNEISPESRAITINSIVFKFLGKFTNGFIK